MRINVLEYFCETVTRHPEKLAVSDDHGAWTFRELHSRAIEIGAAITRSTEAVNQPIAILLPKSREAVASILGTLFSANCYAPLDVKSPASRLKATLENLRPAAIITNQSVGNVLQNEGITAHPLLFVEDMLSTHAEEPAHWQQQIDTDPAYIIHTSGSTGLPKGVAITHRGIIDYIDWARETFPITEQAVIASQAPFVFDNSTLDLYLCFACGATLELVPEELFSFPVRLLQHLANKRVTFIFWVPSIMISAAAKGALDAVPQLNLDTVLFAGEVMPAKQLNAWRTRFPGALFANLYGPTEITVDCTFFIVDRPIRDDEPVPIGRACRNTGILILNDENRPCGTGEAGELCVRGSSLALGYWNNPQQTAAAFVQNPLQSNYPERIYRTGDLVYVNERQEIIFVGRKDSQIKHMGYRIELGEIEHALSRIPGVRHAAAFYQSDKRAIVMVYESEEDIAPGSIRSQLADALPKYMWPTAFHRLPELPRNTSGKIDRPTLTRQFANGTHVSI